MGKDISHLRPVDSGGEPPDMEQRLRHLEQDMVSVKSTLQHIQGTLDNSVATKADLHEVKAEMHSLLRQHIMWNVGSIVAMGWLVFGMMRYTAG